MATVGTGLAQDDGAQAPLRTPLVMVVDDDVDVRASLLDMFASVSLEAMAFESASDMLRHGIPDRPCCLVLDLRLPGTGGLEVQAQLREMNQSVPIVFITGHADVATSVRAMKAGAVDFLPKPFRQQELLDAVIAALRAEGDKFKDHGERDTIRRMGEHLTARETDVLRGVGRGLLNKQIAFELGISEITVKMHRSSAGRKLKSVSVADMLRKIDLLAL